MFTINLASIYTLIAALKKPLQVSFEKFKPISADISSENRPDVFVAVS